MFLLVLFAYSGFADATMEKIQIKTMVKYCPASIMSNQSIPTKRVPTNHIIENSLRLEQASGSHSVVQSNYNPGWVVYTTEFLFSAVPSTINGIWIGYGMGAMEEYFESEYLGVYTGINTLLAPLGTVIGEGIFTLFSEGESKMSGNIWKSALGAAIGSLAGWGMAYWSYYHAGDNIILYSFWFTLPPLGATIGYNL